MFYFKKKKKNDNLCKDEYPEYLVIYTVSIGGSVGCFSPVIVRPSLVNSHTLGCMNSSEFRKLFILRYDFYSFMSFGF